MQLTAVDTILGDYQSTGTWSIVAVNGPAPIVSLAPYSSGLYPANDGVVYAHSTAAVGSMGFQRSLALVYNSAAARPTAIITLDISNPAGGPYPSAYAISVQVNNALRKLLNGRDTVFYAAGTTSTTRVVVALDALADTLTTTGAYSVNVLVSSVYAAGWTTVSVPTRILVNNQLASPFGAGVGLAGIPQLHGVTGSYGMLLTDGGGAVEYFDRSCPTCAFVSPAGESATLDSVTNFNLGGFAYQLTFLDGSYYYFNGSGLVLAHDSFLNTPDLTFSWAGTQLDTINDATGRGFGLSYAGGYLSQITDFANRSTGVSIVSGQLAAVTDPDGFADSLTYGANALLTQLKARSGGVTNFTYNALLQDSTVTGPTATDTLGGQVRPTVSTVTAAEVVWQPSIPGTSASNAKGNVRPDTVTATVADPL